MGLVRKNYGGGFSGYLFLDRKVASVIARFRFSYAPDLASLAKRGLGAGRSLFCRWGCGVAENADHFLLRCPEMGFLTHTLWGFESIGEIYGDSAHWKNVGDILRNVYDECLLRG